MKQIIIVRKDLIDQYGYPKMMVQVAHASTKIFTDKITEDIKYGSEYELEFYDINITDEQYEWTQGNYKKIILYVKSEDKLLKIYEDIKEKYPSVLIKDNALTVYPEPMFTCVGVMGSDYEMEELSKKYRLQLLK
jgi:peptidyl-tRNA hydrolase